MHVHVHVHVHVQCVMCNVLVLVHVKDLLARVDDDVVALPVDLDGAALALVDIPGTQSCTLRNQRISL